MIPNNFHFIESIPLLNREMLISETAVINIYIQQLKESLALDEGTQDLVNFIHDITFGWEHPVCVRARELARACVKELEFLVEFLA